MRRTEVYQGRGLFENLRGAWTDLVQYAPTASPFQTFEWQSTWFRHYGAGRRPLAVSVYEGNDLVGLMPMIRTRGPWRTLRPMGIGPSDYLHPLARAGYEDQVAQCVAETIQGLPGVDLIDLHQVRETNPTATVMASAKDIDQATCLVLDLPKTYDAYLATLGKSLRYDVKKLDKSLFQEGRATIVEATSETVASSLDTLFDQHRRRWKERGMPGAFLGRATRFHHDWARQAVGNGWLRLGVLNLDGAPIGAIYAMSLGETTYYYQAGFDPTKSAVSPGSLLVAHTIRRAIEDGSTRFDFMRGDEPYKRRWKPQHVLTNRRLILPGSSLLGQAGDAWNRAGWRVESRVRARLEGKGLI